jgi:hypothetical protein
MHGLPQWRRQVDPDCPPWMHSSVARLQEGRAAMQEEMVERNRVLEGQAVEWSGV